MKFETTDENVDLGIAMAGYALAKDFLDAKMSKVNEGNPLFHSLYKFKRAFHEGHELKQYFLLIISKIDTAGLDPETHQKIQSAYIKEQTNYMNAQTEVMDLVQSGIGNGLTHLINKASSETIAVEDTFHTNMQKVLEEALPSIPAETQLVEDIKSYIDLVSRTVTAKPSYKVQKTPPTAPLFDFIN